MVKLSTIRANKKNPRKIAGHALDRLCESIQRDPQFMALRPIVVDDTGTVLGGNQRLAACKKLGMSEVADEWVVVASDLTEEQRRRFIVVDNSPDGMAGEWDLDQLGELMTPQELEALGFDFKQLADEFEPQVIDSVPEQYVIMVTCTSETHQREVLDMLNAEGLECRALMS